MNPLVLSTPAPESLRRSFESLRARIELHARVSFRGVRCPHRRADAVAEVVALSCYADHRIMRKACIHLSPTRHLCGCGLA
jgi:hypothetical protein